MTISTTATRVAYDGDGATTAFAVPFPFFAASELEVIARDAAAGAETAKTLGADYTVAGGGGAPGTVTALAAPPATARWVIRRKTARTQATDYTPNDPFPAETHEKALDRLTMIAQELGEQSDRALAFPKTDGADLSAVLPPSLARAGKVAAYDERGQPTVSTLTLAGIEQGTTAAAASAASAATSAAGAAASATAASASETNAAASAALASAAAASVGFSDVVFVTSAQSPIAIGQASGGKLYSVDTSGGNVVFNLPKIAALALPFTVGIKKETADANTVTIDTDATDDFADGGTSKVMSTQFGTTLIPDTDPNPDAWSACDWAGVAISDGAITAAKLADGAVTAAKVAPGVLVPPLAGTARNLKVSTAPSGQTCSWSADEIVAKTALGGTAYLGASKTFAFNGAGTGANGMDTGSMPTSGDLYVYAIYNPTSDTWACLGTIAGSGAEIYGGANLPSGYTASALIFAGKTDGSGNFVSFNQRDRRVWPLGFLNVLSTTSPATSLTSLSISSAVPANAKTASGTMGATANSNAFLVVAADSAGIAKQAVFGNTNAAGPTFTGYYQVAGQWTDIPLIAAQTIYYAAASSGLTVRIDVGSYTF